MDNATVGGRFMKINYNPEISLGNLLQIITIAVGVFAAYSALQQADVRHDQEIKTNTEQIVELKKNQEKIQSEVKEDIKDVKRGVDAINNRLTDVLIENATRKSQR